MPIRRMIGLLIQTNQVTELSLLQFEILARSKWASPVLILVNVTVAEERSLNYLQS